MIQTETREEFVSRVLFKLTKAGQQLYDEMLDAERAKNLMGHLALNLPDPHGRAAYGIRLAILSQKIDNGLLSLLLTMKTETLLGIVYDIAPHLNPSDVVVHIQLALSLARYRRSMEKLSDGEDKNG